MKSVLGDLQIVVERHSNVLKNNALPFHVLLALRLIGFLLSPFSSFLSLLPIQLFSIEIWRIVTSAFVGKNIVLLAWSLCSIHFGSLLLRQASSNEAILKTFGITHVLTCIIVSIISLLQFIFFRSSVLLYESPIVDLIGANTAVLVMIKQFLPDSILLTTPAGRIKYTHLPFCGIFLAFIGSFTGIFHATVFWQVLTGVQVSWTYLRFFNPHESDAVYGDSNEHFTWASLFPRILQPACTILGRICFRSLAKLGVCKRQVRHVDLHSLHTVPINLPGLDSSARDAERRRQKALRALNERLSKTKRIETIKWEDDEEQTVEDKKVLEKSIPEVKTEDIMAEAIHDMEPKEVIEERE
ncbi:unnamed protein product [Auanema sp. JU1783]|nr:unnamed protein product [Auanema sp. JU1783]